ncbi:hypothetical protein [Paenibacillus sp. DMB20]|uniref:hypothetical protein n=1 Tax=Paenibacillus sp. DMB20 TaxID=1642570 RepID=UPI000627BD96|nr:hypothetical protein [Paenibacillus sp. DMB20]KKO53641.1 hypothetical protein XI25_11600 [Paenibacillus sp. DMB20]
MNTLLIALTIVLFSAQTLSMKLIKEGPFRKQLLIYAGFTLLASAGMLLYSIVQPEVRQMSPTTVLFGILFGLGFMLTIIFYNLAIMSGPLSYTAFYFSASMLIPAVTGILAFGEPLTVTTIAAIVLFLMAFYFINANPGSKKGESRANSRWLFYCLMTFLFNGLLAVIQKFHQSRMEGTESAGLMFAGFCSAFVFYALAYAVQHAKGKKRERLTFAGDGAALRDNWLPIILLAATSLTGNIIMTFLSGVVPSSYLFPLVQGSIIVSITLCSVLLFKERISAYGKIGIFLGVTAIVIINL